MTIGFLSCPLLIAGCLRTGDPLVPFSLGEYNTQGTSFPRPTDCFGENLNPRQALFRALTATLIFASAPPCVRATGLDAVSLGIVRLALASGAMSVALILNGKLNLSLLRSLPARTWWSLVLVGAIFGVHWLLFLSSIKLASAAVGAIGISTYGLQLLLLGWILRFSRVSILGACGVGMATVGTLLLVAEFRFQDQLTLGLVLGILSGLAAACLPLLHQYHDTVDVELRTWGQFTFALVVFLGCWPFTQWETFQPRDIPLLLYLGLGVAWIGHGLWVKAVSSLSTNTTSILSYLYLPTTLAFGYVTLGETISGKMLVGTLMILVANALVVYSQARNRTLMAVRMNAS